MKYIEATKKRVLRDRIEGIPAIEITEYKQLRKLSVGCELAIMNNMEMCLAELTEVNNEYAFVYDGVQPILVKPDSFKYGNFMYLIL